MLVSGLAIRVADAISFVLLGWIGTLIVRENVINIRCAVIVKASDVLVNFNFSSVFACLRFQAI